MCARLLLLSWLCVLVVLPSSGCRKPQPPQDTQVEEPTGAGRSRQSGSISLAVEPTSIRLEPGQSARIKITATRRGFPGSINLETRNLPPGVTASAVSLAEGQNTREIELTAAATMKVPAVSEVAEVIAFVDEVQVQSPSFTVRVAEPSFSLTVAPSHLRVSKGESRPVKITIKRSSEGYRGPVEVALANLPKHVTATRIKSKEPAKGASAAADHVEFMIHAGNEASEGGDHKIQAQATGNNLKTGAAFTLTVQGPPFVLQAEPQKVNLVYGRSAKIKITATRKKDYQGSIKLSLENLPPQIKVKPLTLSREQSSGEIELIAADTALSAQKPIQVRGIADDSRQSSSSFDLKVEGRPFELRLEKGNPTVVQGAKAKLKVTVVRSKEFQGPIDLEVRNLPKKYEAFSVGVRVQGKDGEIEITAPGDAVPGEVRGLQVVAIAKMDGDKREVRSPLFGLNVLGPFSLQVQPARVELLDGSKAMLKVIAERRTYQGPIALELRNLPAGVTAGKAEIAKDQQSVDVELTAAAKVPGAEKTDVHVVGTTSTNKQIPSANFTVAVGRKPFDMKVQPLVKVAYGGKALLTVTVQRREYQGPIALEVKNLPAYASGGKTILPGGQNVIDVEIALQDQAKEGKIEGQVIGTAIEGGNKQRVPANFTLQVQPGLFDLKVEPTVLKIQHDSSAKVKVIAVRRGYDGPITVELVKLPKGMKADKATIAKGETQAEIEVKASLSVTEGDRVDVFARGTIAGNKQVESMRFTVSVVSVGQPASVELKVEPASIKVPQGGWAKVKITAVRKGYKGPLSVEMHNLPPELEASKAMIPMEDNTVEITLTARPKAEPGSKADVCAVGIAVEERNCAYASGHITVQVLRK